MNNHQADIKYWLDIDSKVVKTLRFLLAIMVVCIHSYIPNQSNYIIIMMSHTLSHIAVPLFFLFSGYFFYTGLSQWNWRVWEVKMHKRIKTLLIPYFLWIVIFSIFSMLPSFLKGCLSGNIQLPIDWLASNGGIHIFWDSYSWNTEKVDFWGNPSTNTAPILVPFWFLRDLIVTIIFSPILHFFLRKRDSNIGQFISVITLLCFTFLFFTSTSLLLPGFSIIAFLFFSLGAYFQLRGKSIVSFASQKGPILTILALCLLIVEIIFDGHNTLIGEKFYNSWILLGVFATLYITGMCVEKRPKSKRLKLLQGYSNYTFFIFAFHAFLIPYIKIALNIIISKVLCADDLFTVSFSQKHVCTYTVLYVIIVFSTLYLSIIFYKFCKNIIPKICGILIGR